MRSSKTVRVLIVVTAFAVLSGVTFYMPAARAESKEKEKDKDDDEAQAAKDLAEREKKIAEDKARKAAEIEAIAAAETAKKEAAAKAGKPAVKVAPVMPQRCALCQDMKILPNLPFKPYIKFENEPPPNPDYPAPWHICDKCQKDIDAKAAAKEIVEDVKARQERSRGGNRPLEELLKKKFVQFETPYVVVRSMAPAGINHKIAEGLEKCAGILEGNSKSMVLMTTRPDEDQIIFIGDEPSFIKYIDATSGNADAKQKEMLKKGSGLCAKHLEMDDLGKPGSRPECFGVFAFGGLLMSSATDFKAKPWLTEGFSSYCENATFGTNTVYRMAYELNAGVKFGKNWNDDMKKLARDNKLKMWEEIFEISLEHLKSLEYLHCYSMVSFLVKMDPARFDKFVLLVKDGMDAGPAIELAYGKPSKEIQMMWRAWIPTQK